MNQAPSVPPAAMNDANIELRHLRYFAAVAEELHFGRAAARLGIAQPPLSQQIQRLEAMLGTPLFDRSRRQVQLTDAGRALKEECGRVLAAMERALEGTRRAARGEVGTVTVAFAASVMFETLPQLIRAFREQFPAVRLELRELPTAFQLAGLRSGDLDVGFAREPQPEDGLRMETVMTEPLLAAMARAHPLAQDPGPLPLSALADEPFVLFPREIAPGLHHQVVTLCRQAGFTPQVAQESRELYTTVSLVEAEVGVTIVPASIQKLGWSGVAYRRLAEPDSHTRIDMTWRADNERPAVQRFLELVLGSTR
jgi:DNA-binding transcriptional LysR family regulator